MTSRRLYLFDDGRARNWAPFSLMRPVGELLYGGLTLRRRTERALGLPCEGHLCGRDLEGFDEPGSAPAVTRKDLPADGARVLLSSRAVLDLRGAPDLPAPARILIAGECVGWVVPEGAPLPDGPFLEDPSLSTSDGTDLELPGEVLRSPWDLMAGNAARLSADFELLWGDHLADDPAGTHRVGGGALSLGEGAEVEPGVILDLRDGPIRLEAGARVQGPARLTGPLLVGAGTVVLGGRVGVSTIGPVCKIHGEVTDSVIHGYVNKAHDGHLGHAVLGAWVNLGAFTTNSDLKNNYGTIRVWTPDGTMETGLLKVGVFLGDHVKTGIGTPLNSGTVVGAGSNIFGGLMPPAVVPPFSWGSGNDLREYRLDRFLQTTERAMARRSVELTPGMRAVLTQAWNTTRPRHFV